MRQLVPGMALVAGLLFAGAVPAAPKNVVLLVTDDQGQDAGCYGNKVIKTPNQDALAADGTLFRNAFCTTASCSASRSVILTGLHNHANGQYGHQHSYHKFSAFPNIKSLPVLLGQAGYRTARVGKYHVAPDEVFKFDRAIKGNARSPVEMADNCKDFIAAKSDKPFFLYYCTADPHRGGGRVEDLPGKPDRFGNRPRGYPGIKEVHYDPKDVIVPPFLPDIPVCRQELAQYYQSVSRVDQGLGRLIQHLKDAGQWDNTLFIYISDHGIAFPGAKTTVYEPGLKSPCIVRHPGLKQRGNECNAMISWVDLTPTILDYAGAMPKGQKFHGRSFLSILGEKNPKGWDEVYASHTFHEITMYYPMRVVRTRKYKLIWNIASPLPYPFASDLWAAPTWQEVYRRGPDALYGKRTVKAYIHRAPFELYDLEKDPDEIHNLAGDAKHAGVLAELKGKLRDFQKRTRDPWILKWDYE
jgi:N-sulfoglucosamine sulfohydrolase